jgi:hypothetical protein
VLPIAVTSYMSNVEGRCSGLFRHLVMMHGVFCGGFSLVYYMAPPRYLLSTVSSDGTPKRQTMFCQKNFWVVFDVIVETALASIHFVKYSMAMKVNLRFP